MLSLSLISGLCGSITSFSAFEFEAFMLFLNSSFLSGLGILLFTIPISLFAFKLGTHLSLKSSLIHPSESLHAPVLRFDEFTPGFKYLDIFVSLLGVGLVIGVIIASVLFTKERFVLSMLFAPFGAILRFHICGWFNNGNRFFVGTFIGIYHHMINM